MARTCGVRRGSGTVGNLDLVVRVGDPVPDGAGNDTTDTFKAFKNLALSSEGPLFLASTTGKQNFGLWGTDSTGPTRSSCGTAPPSTPSSISS